MSLSCSRYSSLRDSSFMLLPPCRSFQVSWAQRRAPQGKPQDPCRKGLDLRLAVGVAVLDQRHEHDAAHGVAEGGPEEELAEVAEVRALTREDARQHFGRPGHAVMQVEEADGEGHQ